MAEITFVVASLTVKVTVITFVVAEITFKVDVATCSVGKIIFCGDQNHFLVADMSFVVAKITKITYNSG